jgi:hypothetical protein
LALSDTMTATEKKWKLIVKNRLGNAKERVEVKLH